MFFNILQLIGGLILSFGYIPQIIQIIRTKSAHDLNLKTFSMTLLGICFMEIYAVNLIIHNVGGAYFITNTISLITAVIMVILILKYGGQPNKGNIQDENANDK